MGILGALLRLLQSRRDAVLRSSWGRDVGAGFFKTADKASGSLVTLTSPADFAGAFVLASARGQAHCSCCRPRFSARLCKPSSNSPSAQNLPAMTLFPDFARAGGLMADRHVSPVRRRDRQCAAGKETSRSADRTADSVRVRGESQNCENLGGKVP